MCVSVFFFVKQTTAYEGRISDWSSDVCSSDLMDVDERGLDAMDRRYMRCIADNYGGGPVGVETMAAALSEQRDVLEEVIEPYLIQQGLVQRTPRGRMLTRGAFTYLGLDVPRSFAQFDLLDGAAAVGEGEA